MAIQPNSIQLINVAQLIGSVNIVTIKCACVNKEILMGQMGQPIVCYSCKRTWYVSARSEIKIQEVLGDAVKESNPSKFFD